MWKDDDELFALAEKHLFSCVVGDVMDKMKLYHQYLPPQIKAIHPDMVLLGRAMPVLSGDVFVESLSGTANAIAEKPFGLMLRALDDLKRNEIYVNTGCSPRNALWGEMMATRATHLGARGAVLNGYVRDTRGLLAMKFPTFGFGSFGQDSGPRHKVYDFRVPIEIEGISIQPGDIVFGDIDGALVVPRHAEEEVFRLAFEKALGEKSVRKDLLEGVSAEAAFGKHGIM